MVMVDARSRSGLIEALRPGLRAGEAGLEPKPEKPGRPAMPLKPIGSGREVAGGSAISNTQASELGIFQRDKLRNDADLFMHSPTIIPGEKQLRFQPVRLFIASLVIRIAAFFIRLRERL